MINELKLHLSKLIKDYTKRKYLLAVSGGVDSVVLAALFNDMGLDFSLAHCNFQLRGVDSDADERLVSILSQKIQKDFLLKRFETQQYADYQKVSIQMAARALRYEWFHELAKEKGFDFIVTAHHKNDLTETILLNLVKGTGHTGMVGIKGLQEQLLRPLLQFEKSELVEYAKQNELSWREDSSNSIDKYQRNHLRINVIPLLKEINPKVDEAFSRTAEKMSAANEFIQKQIKKIKQQYVRYKAGGIVEISLEIFSEDLTITFVLSELLREYGFDFAKSVKIAEIDRTEPGASFISQSHHLVNTAHSFIIAPIFKPMISEICFEDVPNACTFGNYEFMAEKKTYDPDMVIGKMELLLPTKYQGEKLTIRYPKSGDSMAPYGMNGKRKKVADILNDAKIPLNLKNYIPIFQIEDEIIWVVGIRSSHYCKVEKGEDVIVVRAYLH